MRSASQILLNHKKPETHKRCTSRSSPRAALKLQHSSTRSKLPSLRTQTGKGVVFLFLEATWGRRVLSGPRRRTVRSHQEFSPNGQPLVTQRRKAANSASYCGALTCSNQPGRRGSGQAANNDFPVRAISALTSSPSATARHAAPDGHARHGTSRNDKPYRSGPRHGPGTT